MDCLTLKFFRVVCGSYRTKSVMCVPLKAKGRVLAVIQAVNKVPSDTAAASLSQLESTVSPASLASSFAPFTSDDLDVLSALALTAGGVIFKLQLQDRMVRAQ